MNTPGLYTIVAAPINATGYHSNEQYYNIRSKSPYRSESQCEKNNE